MDRFIWLQDQSLAGIPICSQDGVALYDGDDKTAFENGTLMLSPLSLAWTDREDPNCRLALDLRLVLKSSHKSKRFTSSAKISLDLAPAPPEFRSHSPLASSQFSHVMLSFRKSGDSEFFAQLSRILKEKAWTASPVRPVGSTRQNPTSGFGIAGIERKIEQEHQAASVNISVAFHDLSKLIDSAKEMVCLSKSITEKIEKQQGDISDDEIVKFKSDLLKMGIENPVTSDTYGSSDLYYIDLAKEIARAMVAEIEKDSSGGMITLTDVYCRINRMRGLNLLSPDDLLKSCKLMECLDLPVKLHKFHSGVYVLLLANHDMKNMLDQTIKSVEEKEFMNSQQFAQFLGISVILAQERLLYAEREGGLCRDETVEGLYFYPNLFLHPKLLF